MISNDNMLGKNGLLEPSLYKKFIDILTNYEDRLSNILYYDAISGILINQYGGVFVSIFERLLRVYWLDNKSKHDLINFVMLEASSFGSVHYFVKILSIILETKNIVIEPSLGDLSIIVIGGSSQLLANIVTYEKSLIQVNYLDAKEHMAQVESKVFGSEQAGGFLRSFLSNFLVCGDFASITLEAIV